MNVFIMYHISMWNITVCYVPFTCMVPVLSTYNLVFCQSVTNVQNGHELGRQGEVGHRETKGFDWTKQKSFLLLRCLTPHSREIESESRRCTQIFTDGAGKGEVRRRVIYQTRPLKHQPNSRTDRWTRERSARLKSEAVNPI